jgi:hypothetical protein
MGYNSRRSILDPIRAVNIGKKRIPGSMSTTSSLTSPLILPTDKNILGFCKGAIRLFAGLENKAFAINNRPVGISGVILPYWKCQKCPFEGLCILNWPLGQKRSKAKITYDLQVRKCAGGGVLYRWAFLAKCHVSIRSAAELGTPEQRHGDYGTFGTFGCIFCACEAQRRGWALSGNDIYGWTEGKDYGMKHGRDAASVDSGAGAGTPSSGMWQVLWSICNCTGGKRCGPG